MKFQDRQKMCSHCDGRIAVEAELCPYCGMPFAGETEGSPKVVAQTGLSSQESLSSLYPPPYSNRNSSHMKTDKELTSKFKTPQMQVDNPFGKMPFQSGATVAPEVENKEQEEKSGFMSLLFMLLGSNLLTLGLMQGLFSQGGFLRLEWSCKYWVFYCLFAVPMIYFGIRKTRTLKESS